MKNCYTIEEHTSVKASTLPPGTWVRLACKHQKGRLCIIPCGLLRKEHGCHLIDPVTGDWWTADLECVPLPAGTRVIVTISD